MTVAKPQLVGAAVKVLDAEEGDWAATLEASESKPAKYEERFMMDAGITGGGWVRISRGKWSLWTDGDAGADPEGGDAQLCVQVQWKLGADRDDPPPLQSAGTGAAFQRLCPLRVLSFDVLHDGGIRQLHQPDASRTRLLGVTVVLDAAGEIYRTAVIVRPRPPVNTGGRAAAAAAAAGGGQRAALTVAGGAVHTRFVADQADLLRAFEALVVELDPDFITGTDLGHSMQLLQFKAEILKCKDWGAGFGRGGALKVKKKQTYNPKWVKSAGRQSASSNQEGKEISSSGRIFIDVR